MKERVWPTDLWLSALSAAVGSVTKTKKVTDKSQTRPGYRFLAGGKVPTKREKTSCIFWMGSTT